MHSVRLPEKAEAYRAGCPEMLLAIWSHDRQARPGGADTSALWRSIQGMNFTEWISLYQIINFIMDCIWLYTISSGVFLMSSYFYIS